MEADYIHIMAESLEKKQDVLGRILELNRQQDFLLQDPNLSPEEFEQNMQFKSSMVEQLNLLDNGFEELYERVRDLLNTNREQYAKEIVQMQELIKDITAKTLGRKQEKGLLERLSANKAKVREKEAKEPRESQKTRQEPSL